MIVNKKAISRRTMLRGIGTAVALPFLDSMAPALSAAPKPVNRFGALYVPNGIMMDNWTPAAEGAAFELTPILKALAPYRDQLMVLTGLNSTPPPERAASLQGVHSRASTRFLTDIQPKPTLGSDLEAGISMDQIAANEIGDSTQFASLQIGLDSNDTAGGGDTGYSRAYCSTISWRGPQTPLPMENNPRILFERLFGDGVGAEPSARRVRSQEDRSILDSVTAKIKGLQVKLGPSDSSKLVEYMDSIRDVEKRIQKAEAKGVTEVSIEHPVGIPEDFAEHAKVMFDLMTLAYQSDLTRVISFMISREFNSRTYPELGIHDGHHAVSHHLNSPEKLAQLVKINTMHVELFTYFLAKLKATPDGDGSLLDHLMLIYGSGMSDGNSHWPLDLPILLIGGGAGTLKPGRHNRYKKGTPLANLHLSILDRLGVHIDKLGDSSGRCEQLSDV